MKVNILVLLGGSSTFFDNQQYHFPKSLIEIKGKPMIQHVVENLKNIAIDKKFVFAVKKSDCDKFHLKNVLKLLTENQCEVVALQRETKGAACSALMAVDSIDSDTPLIISNGDQVIDTDLCLILEQFFGGNCDAAVVCFESVHPRWSYVLVDENDQVVEAVEKNPISKNAIAGIYIFRRGTDFVRAAMNSIKKDASVDGLYYIAPTLNELILENKSVAMFKIDRQDYHSFYSPHKIKEYEELRR